MFPLWEQTAVRPALLGLELYDALGAGQGIVSGRRLGEAGAGGEMRAEDVGFALADGKACASRRTQGADRV